MKEALSSRNIISIIVHTNRMYRASNHQPRSQPFAHTPTNPMHDEHHLPSLEPHTSNKTSILRVSSCSRPILLRILVQQQQRTTSTSTTTRCSHMRWKFEVGRTAESPSVSGPCKGGRDVDILPSSLSGPWGQDMHFLRLFDGELVSKQHGNQ